MNRIYSYNILTCSIFIHDAFFFFFFFKFGCVSVPWVFPIFFEACKVQRLIFWHYLTKQYWYIHLRMICKHNFFLHLPSQESSTSYIHISKIYFQISDMILNAILIIGHKWLNHWSLSKLLNKSGKLLFLAYST